MSDITPKEAIANLNHIYGMVAPDIQRSLDVAIKALERPQGDCISREALKNDISEKLCDKFDKWSKTITVSEFEAVVIDVIDNAPPVEAFTLEDMQNNYDAGVDSVIGKYDKAKGEWIDYSDEGYVECPFCGSATTCDDNKDELHYCWNCGADMSGGNK